MCETLWDPMDHSSPGSSVHGILQAGILEWMAIPSFRESSPPGDQIHISYHSCIGSRVFLLLAPPGKPHMKVTDWQILIKSLFMSLVVNSAFGICVLLRLSFHSHNKCFFTIHEKTTTTTKKMTIRKYFLQLLSSLYSYQ